MRIGIGFADALTTLGSGEKLWQALLEGRCGLIEASTVFPHTAAPTGGIGCFAQIPSGEPRVRWILERMYEQFLSGCPLDRCDTILIASNFGDMCAVGSQSVSDVIESFLDIYFPFRACRRAVIVSSACSSGTDVVSIAAQLVDSGAASLVAALAVDCFDELKLLQHCNLGTQSLGCARPFDVGRDGTSFGEGGGAMLLGSPERLREISLPLLACIRGFGASCDGFDLTAPDPSGTYAAAAISTALAMAPELAGEIAFVKGHGSGTPRNDEAEARALHLAFGERAGNIPVFSTKGAIGHLLGATGLVELVLAVRALSNGVVPGTVGSTMPDPALGVSVSSLPRETNAIAAIAMTFGFGGVNSAVVVSKGNYG